MTKEQEYIKWRFKWLKENANQLRENDLDWAIKLEESYNRKGFLSDRELKVLENIYERY